MSSRIELYIGGSIFSGWLTVSVRRSLEHLAGSFELGLMLPGERIPSALRTGQSLTLRINGQTVISGWLDQVSQRISATRHQISISGRDKTGDLVDCAAIHPGSQWRNRTLAQIAADLCAPFGIAVRWQVNDDTAARPFSSFTLENSETVADALTRAARHRGVLVTSNADGDLVFTQAGSQQTDRLVLGDNLLDADYNTDWRGRYSEYRVRGHGRGGGKRGDSESAARLAAPVGVISDEQIGRYRPKIILADQQTDITGARQRALREMRRAIARSERFSATVRGWFRDDGRLWDVNLLTGVSALRFGIEQTELLVCQVEFLLDEHNGEVTRLVLAPRDGFIVPAEPDSKGRGGSGDDVDAFIRQQMKNRGSALMNDEVFSRLIAPVTRGIRLLFGRGVLTGTHDELKMQNVQLTGMDGETFDDVERPQQYGQISVPLPGAETFFACLGGQRDQTVVLVVEDRRSRPTGLTAGDTGVYHHEGHRIRLTKDGRIIVTCKMLEIYADEGMRVDTPEATFTGNVTVDKNLHVKGNFVLDGTGKSDGLFTMSDAVIAGITYSGHVHQDNGKGSKTGAPENG